MNGREKLIQLIREDKVLPMVGAGVSYATAGLPGWRKLIELGVAYGVDRRIVSAEDEQSIRDLLDSNELTAAAQKVKRCLNAPWHPFSDWLNDLFHQPVVGSPDLIRSIKNLCTPMMATTNYDPVLGLVGLNQYPSTFDWSQSEEILRAMRNREKFILHLHGRYSKPETTIFGADDYEKLAGQLAYKTILQELWTTKHFLFIGCSTEGVLDEDFSTVLRFMQRWFPSFPHEHFLLMKEGEIAKGKHITLLKEYNVHALQPRAAFLQYFRDQPRQFLPRLRRQERRQLVRLFLHRVDPIFHQQTEQKQMPSAHRKTQLKLLAHPRSIQREIINLRQFLVRHID